MAIVLLANRATKLPLWRWFAAFIFFCGVGHGFKIWTVYRPDYWAQTVWDLITMAVSVITAAKATLLLNSAPAQRVLAGAADLLEAKRRVDAYPFPAFLCGPDGGNLAVNKSYQEILGIDGKTSSGFLWERYVEQEYRERYSQGGGAECHNRH